METYGIIQRQIVDFALGAFFSDLYFTSFEQYMVSRMMCVVFSMLLFVSVCLCATAASSLGEAQTLGQFEQFIRDFNKSYSSSDEYSARYTVFKQNLLTIAQLSAKYPTAQFGVTASADVSSDDYRNALNAAVVSTPDHLLFSTPSVTSLPTDLVTINWVEKGAVAPILDQGSSCPAAASYFASAASLESANAISNKILVPVSPQEPIDCDVDTKTDHCKQGSTPALYYFYTMRVTGACSLAKYPFKGEKGECYCDMCDDDVPNPLHYDNIGTTEAAHYHALLKGPIAVQLAGGNDIWRFYKGGLLTSDGGDKTVNTYALIVGFDKDVASGQYYYRIKGSWGTAWGDAGYASVLFGTKLFGISTSKEDAQPFMSWS